jgi:hypothetical protein
MKYAITALRVATCLALLSAASAFTQTSDDEAAAKKAAPVAYVYIQTNPGVLAFAAAANGQLTLVKGSPFKVSGQMEDISGKILISVGNTYLHTYPIESNGAIGKQISQINTANYGGSECGDTSAPGSFGLGSVLDHTGKYLYVQLNSLNTCDDWQSYKVESNGFLEFIGDQEYYAKDGENHFIWSSVPTVDSTDKFLYGVIDEAVYTGPNGCYDSGDYCPYFSAYTKLPDGQIYWNTNFTETDPVAESGYAFYPSSGSRMQADPSGHLAVIMNELDGHGDYNTSQLASYTINPSTGAISSTNTWENMPFVEVTNPPFSMSMSPSGKLLAVAGGGGLGNLEIFHFNGGAPATLFNDGGLLVNLLGTLNLNQVKWDNNNHLYALSYDNAQLFVFTVTPTSIKEAPGSYYNLPYSLYGTYGTIGMVVIP